MTKVCFLHISKASGTSVQVYLRSQFADLQVAPARFGAEYAALDPTRLADFDLFHAECDASVIARLPPATSVVTMVREPLARARSHWRYVMRIPGHPLRAQLPDPHVAFGDFLDAMPANPMARLLAAVEVDHPRSLWNPSCEVDDDELLDRATARLEACSFVGLTEHHDESIAQIAHLFGWAPPGALPVTNAVPSTSPADEPTAAEEAAFCTRHQVDIELYRVATAMFHRRARLTDGPARSCAYERRLTQLSEPLTDRLIVDVCSPIQGSGWLPVAGDGIDRLRPVAAGVAGATIDLPVTLGPFTMLDVTCPAIASTEVLDTLEVTVDDQPVLLSHRNGPLGLVLRAAVPVTRIGRGFTRIRFRADHGVEVPSHDGANGSDLVVTLGVSRIELASHDPLASRVPSGVTPSAPGARAADYYWRCGATWTFDVELQERLDRLGLWDNVVELQRDGFTVIRDVVDPETVRRARDSIIRLAVGSHNRTRRRDAIQPFRHDPLFLDLLVEPVQLAMADAVCGKGLLDSQAGLVRDVTSNPQGLHAENALWLPAPYPDHHYICSSMLTLDHFDEANGGTCFVPGSHLTKLDPTPEGSVELTGAVTPDAPPGSLIIWVGGTWHGARQRLTEGERVSLLTIFTRPSLRPAQDIRSIPSSLIDTDELQVRLRRKDPYEHDGWMVQRPGQMMNWTRNLSTDGDRTVTCEWDETVADRPRVPGADDATLTRVAQQRC